MRRKGPALLSCGVAKLQAGGGDGGWERCGHVRFRDQVPVACTVGGTCISWTQKVETGVHSPPAPSRIGQQLAHRALLIGSWTVMADAQTRKQYELDQQTRSVGRGTATHSCQYCGQDLRRDEICYASVLLFFFHPLLFVSCFLCFSHSSFFSLFFPFSLSFPSFLGLDGVTTPRKLLVLPNTLYIKVRYIIP